MLKLVQPSTPPSALSFNERVFIKQGQYCGSDGMIKEQRGSRYLVKVIREKYDYITVWCERSQLEVKERA